MQSILQTKCQRTISAIMADFKSKICHFDKILIDTAIKTVKNDRFKHITRAIEWKPAGKGGYYAQNIFTLLRLITAKSNNDK